MPSQLLLMGGLFGGLLLAVFFLMRVSKGKGRTEGKLEAIEDHNVIVNKNNAEVAKANEDILKQVEETHEIHDRLQSDPVFAERVRDRFTRD